MFYVILNTLQTKKIRVTIRDDDRLSEYCDGEPAEAKALILKMMNQELRSQKNRDGSFDMEYIRLNAAATEAMK